MGRTCNCRKARWWKLNRNIKLAFLKSEQWLINAKMLGRHEGNCRVSVTSNSLHVTDIWSIACGSWGTGGGLSYLVPHKGRHMSTQLCKLTHTQTETHLKSLETWSVIRIGLVSQTTGSPSNQQASASIHTWKHTHIHSHTPAAAPGVLRCGLPTRE